jgi:transcriptional regulator of heat shock response
MSTLNIIEQVENKKLEDLKNTVNEQLLARAIAKLDEKKIEVAKKLFAK